MSVSPISSTRPPVVPQIPMSFAPTSPVGSAPTPVSPAGQFRSDFASLLSAVQSGDITTAQQALTQVQSDFSASGGTYSPQSQPQAAMPTDLQSLFSAVQSGNVSAAQQALTQLQSDSQQSSTQGQSNGTPVHGHHHHHHHGGGAAPAATQPADSSSSTATDTDGSASPLDTPGFDL